MNSELIEQIEAIIAFLFTIKIVAVAIVNLTPTPEDNKWLGRFYKVLEIVAGIITTTAKEFPGEHGHLDERLRVQSESKTGSTKPTDKPVRPADPRGVWGDDH